MTTTMESLKKQTAKRVLEAARAAAPNADLEACRAALLVMTKAPAIRAWLEEHDKMALQQAEDALAGKGTKPHPIIGATITSIRGMTQAEADTEGWWFGRHGMPGVLVLSNGTVLYASRDEEGNGHGCIFGRDSKGEGLQVPSI